MISTNDYILVPYLANGRDLDGMDCWGLVRHARVHMFGKELLPAYDGVEPSDKRSLTKLSYSCLANHEFKEVEFKEGAIACAFQGSICMHVGICVKADGRMWILETDINHGTSLTEKRVFENRFTKVTYHDN